MAQIIDGKQIADKIKHHIHKEIAGINSDNLVQSAPKRPNLAIILVGEREDSLLYVNLKEKEAKKVGIDTHLYKCPADIPEREIFETIRHLNEDETIDAILVQLPLPPGYDTDGIIRAIDPAKDVDRFHPDNLEPLLSSCELSGMLPPLFRVVFRIMEEIDFAAAGKQAVVVSKSDIFGQSLAMVLGCKQMQARTVGPDDPDLAQKTAAADLLIPIVGKPEFIGRDMVKKDAVVIDVGISKVEGRTKGDVDYEAVKDKVSAITPVPGGVGPITIAMLFRNTLEIYKKRKGCG